MTLLLTRFASQKDGHEAEEMRSFGRKSVVAPLGQASGSEQEILRALTGEMIRPTILS